MTRLINMVPRLLKIIRSSTLLIVLLKGFEVAVMKEAVPDVIDLTHYSDFS